MKFIARTPAAPFEEVEMPSAACAVDQAAYLTTTTGRKFQAWLIEDGFYYVLTYPLVLTPTGYIVPPRDAPETTAGI